MDGVASGAERAMGRYLLDGERMVVAVHQHWWRVAGVVAGTVIGLVLVVAIALITPASAGLVSDLAWWVWLALLVYCLLQLLMWRHDWFVATDRRLLLTYGLVSHKVAMMPLAKVTDMSFNQSVAARFLGYGTFVMESAGQDQALRQIDYIPDAGLHYRSICAEIFGEEESDGEDSNEPQHQHHHRSAEPVDATDPYGIPVPVHRPLRADAQERPPREYGANRRRVVRAATVLSDDPEASWSVSHEDAPPPQRVRPRHDPRTDDDRP
ncbi:PH domain-containing protein [Allobranchiibius sp. CTAmp26]|uniref:PH domain-containing protein n=1 Tax=Allobranchiibius sp. CTAmp26 TaxID=2815214 RepID=UPI001AA18D96|nr:PH domain-containing protein [Allobranchiibius sp. CTAmp26]MBO1756738.1 PH domain-containing protein [Allobranchiibius sp. CTAmp26]